MDRSRQVLIVAVLFLATFSAATYVYFRSVYTHGKRLRIVAPGRLYRSGQLTTGGFTEAVRRYGIRTILNVQEDVPDPDLWHSYFDRSTVKESALCKQLGVRYIWLTPDVVSRQEEHPRPRVIDEFLAIMDDPATHPVLIHCKAGLHRTGLLSAVYRMEYQGWSHLAALTELRAHGFGEWAASSANDYVDQYLLRYEPRHAPAPSIVRPIGVGRP
jgi:tyrosine-protein phosphatase SIW14